MTDQERTIASEIILLEAEREIDRLEDLVKFYKQSIEQITIEKNAFHNVARDFWVYGKASPGKSNEWDSTLAEFDRLEGNTI